MRPRRRAIDGFAARNRMRLLPEHVSPVKPRDQGRTSRSAEPFSQPFRLTGVHHDCVRTSNACEGCLEVLETGRCAGARCNRCVYPKAKV